MRLALALLVSGVIAAAALPLAKRADAARAPDPAAKAKAAEADRCEPHSWVDWHIAMSRSCLTPAYVCHNMTTGKMLDDPAIRDQIRRALEAGDPQPTARLEALVAQMRARYGCEDEDSAGPDAPALPPGHPPVHGGRQLPPGHPPADDPPALAPPLFEAPQSVTI